MTKKILKFLNHERYQVVAVLLCLAAIVGGLSCQSTTRSVLDPTRNVTRLELIAEIQSFNSLAEARIAQLDRQDELRSQLLDLFALWTTTGQFNPAGMIGLLASVLGVGAIADNVRKRGDIKKLNNAGTSK